MAPRKGFKHSEETKKKMSESAKRVSKGKWMKGRKFTPEHILNRSIAQSGENNGSWKDGRSKDKTWRSWIKNRRNRLKRRCNGSHTYEEWEALKAKYNWVCPSCRKKEPDVQLTQDHIVPVSKGGMDDIENIQPLCRSCNSKKHNKTVKYKVAS